MSDESNGRTVIAKGTTFAGKVKSQSPVTVNGTVEGELEAPELDVAAGGVVSGRIQVDTLRSEGEIAGTIEAKQLTLAGRVRDDTSIRAGQIEVKLSGDAGAPLALTFGTAKVEVGERPKSEGGKSGNGGKGQKG